MFSGCSGIKEERLELAEPLGWPFGVPACFSAAAACLRVRMLGEPFILGVTLVPEAQSKILVETLKRQGRRSRSDGCVQRLSGTGNWAV